MRHTSSASELLFELTADYSSDEEFYNDNDIFDQEQEEEVSGVWEQQATGGFKRSLPLPSLVRLENACSLCLVDQKDLENDSLITLRGCSHVICGSCLSDYLRLRFNETKTVHFVRSNLKKTEEALILSVDELTGAPCPCSQCTSIITGDDIKKYADSHTYQKFDQFALDEEIGNMRSILPKCQDCGYILQENCLCVNPDCRMRQIKARDRKLMKERSRGAFPGVKCCPKCYFEIEKNGGCDHMYCTRCSTNFNWSQAPTYGKGKAWFRLQLRTLYQRSHTKPTAQSN